MKQEKTTSIKWLSALIGLIFIAFGLVKVFNGNTTLATQISYLGLTLMGAGILAGIYSFILYKRKASYWKQSLLSLLHLALGLGILAMPQEALSVFRYLIGAWSICLAVILGIMALKQAKYSIVTWLNSLLCLAFGLWAIYNDSNNYLMSWGLSLFSIILGVFLIYWGLFRNSSKNKADNKGIAASRDKPKA
jgi:uncharacterized membrane protein HdeD (DUF308 family)